MKGVADLSKLASITFQSRKSDLTVYDDSVWSAEIPITTMETRISQLKGRRPAKLSIDFCSDEQPPARIQYGGQNYKIHSQVHDTVNYELDTETTFDTAWIKDVLKEAKKSKPDPACVICDRQAGNYAIGIDGTGEPTKAEDCGAYRAACKECHDEFYGLISEEQQAENAILARSLECQQPTSCTAPSKVAEASLALQKGLEAFTGAVTTAAQASEHTKSVLTTLSEQLARKNASRPDVRRTRS